jgi:phosphatidylglycerol:prolipoprotein diacylglycerol transferase
VGLDAAAVGLALGQAIGRLGCLAAGCATGVVLPPGSAWPALPLPDSTGLVAPRFPSQIVESLADVLLWGLLLWLWARRLRPGAVAVAYLIGFGALRFLAEPLRENAPALGPFTWTLTWGQAWGALAVLIGVAVLLRWTLPRRGRPAPEYAGDA